MPTIRIMAGPGTGKTYEMMRRIGRLLDDGADPHQIFLVTFTRTAAADLRRSLDNDIGKTRAEGIYSGTLHSFCLNMLYNNVGYFTSTGRVPRVVNDFELNFMFEDLKQEGAGSLTEIREHLHAFEAGWAREQDQQPGWATSDAERRFDDALHRWLRFHNAMLLDEIIPESLKYLRNNPHLDVIRRFRFVLVDEYQDLNRAEQSLIDILATDSAFTVVGDEDQSIYESMRYAHPEGIRNFHVSHPDTEDMTLEQCRRCPQLVVNMANNLIQINNMREKHTLNPKPDNIVGEVNVIQWETIEAEARGIAEFLNVKVRTGEYDPGKTLVLSPRRQIGVAIRDALVALGQNAHSFFREEALYGNPKKPGEYDAQQAFTLLRLVENREDRVALRVWLGFGHRELRSSEYKRLYAYCLGNNISPLEGLRRLSENPALISGKTTGIAQRFQELMAHLEALEDNSLQETLDYVFPRTEAWSSAFWEIIGDTDQETSITDVLQKLLEEISQPEMPTDVEYIRIMSLHKSKGLTADHVIVVGLIDGLIPRYSDGIEGYERERLIEEQRRLFYVAVTRTKASLILSSMRTLPRRDAMRMGARVARPHGTLVDTVASPFIHELGADCPLCIPGETWITRVEGN